ncbi:aminotransferase-like domain-containing protein [Streptococcus loxodontisalivarius]|uniref:DNA-binding transcriptional MocR family regulator n=1 Tax=Streptococcus loxodontisalivarius TaxID=1349415 RepID=A0ABS2PPW6_9STRE|nr:PLP-dependent aminotransferase family protein [Streptococcus loxodontisalivarius]MBM7641993.1 DNA-binding transcriptional MocR family regulator [Streptococcus loxodontisalivarius]
MAIYQKIIKDIQASIETGQLKKGDKIPSIRQLSQTYHCSKDTVQKALTELTYLKDIYAIPKSGYYVLENKAEQIEPVELSISDYNNLAYDDFLLCMNESLVGRELYLFNQYQHQEGLLELRKSLKTYLADSYVYTKQENIVVTSGTQQALYILSQMTFPNQKSTILLEQPTYSRMNSLVREQQLAFEIIERQFSGLDFADLERLFSQKSIKFFYTISRYSNPLGLTYSQKDKERLLELAEKYDVYIIEDDYMGDFTKDKEAPLHYYDTHERVIYLKSFSTALFPALRLGMIVLPDQLKADFLSYKKLLDYDTNLIIQKAMSLYLDNGMFDKNLRHLKQAFFKQMSLCQEMLAPYQESLAYQITPRHLIVQLPAKVSLGKLSRQKVYQKITTSSIKQSILTYIRLNLDDQFENNIKLLLDQIIPQIEK